MTMPVKLIDKEVCVLKMGWLAVEDILVKVATVVVNYVCWRLVKTGQKDLKWMGVCMGDSCDCMTSNP